VERREGEDMRRTPLSREWAGAAASRRAGRRSTATKRSLTLDLQKADAIKIVKQLATEVDVVMENFRPGVMDKLGIGYEALSAIKPAADLLRHFRFSARPDLNGSARAMTARFRHCRASWRSRVMRKAGRPRGLCGLRRAVGSTAAFGVSSALFQRTHTGKGQLVDSPCWKPRWRFCRARSRITPWAGHRQQQSGNQAVSRRPTAICSGRARAIWLLAVNSEKQYRGLMDGLGRAEVLDDPRFVDWFARQENEPALRAIIEEALAKKSAPRMGDNTGGGRRPMRQHLEDRGGDRSSADRSARRASGDRYTLWPPALRRQRFPARPWRRQARFDGARTQRPIPTRCSPRSVTGGRPSPTLARTRDRLSGRYGYVTPMERHRERQSPQRNRIAFLPVCSPQSVAPICAVSNSSHGNARLSQRFLGKRCADVRAQRVNGFRRGVTHAEICPADRRCAPRSPTPPWPMIPVA